MHIQNDIYVCNALLWDRKAAELSLCVVEGQTVEVAK